MKGIRIEKDKIRKKACVSRKDFEKGRQQI